MILKEDNCDYNNVDNSLLIWPQAFIKKLEVKQPVTFFKQWSFAQATLLKM